MNLFLIFIAIVIITCVMLNNATNRVGVPVLLAFILLGMLFGNNGLLPVKVESYKAVEQICSAALIFIMFYGGFGTRWDAARPVAAESVLLATAGVVLTAGFTGAFCHFLLRWQWPEALLMGSVVASTDAASVFSILRSRKLGLKNGTAPLLELESGSNDPCSYMLTAVMLSVMQGTASGGQIMWQLFAQLFFGAVLGLLIAQAAAFGLRHITFATSGFDSMFLIAVALFAYAIPAAVGGNGYLSVYIVGMILGAVFFTGKAVECLDIVDNFINSYTLVLTGALEALAIGWMFKTRKALKEINRNTNKFRMPAWLFYTSIKVVTPVILLGLFAWNVYTLIVGGGIYGKADGYSLATNVVFGWAIMFLSIITGLIIKMVAAPRAKKGKYVQALDWNDTEAAPEAVEAAPAEAAAEEAAPEVVEAAPVEEAPVAEEAAPAEELSEEEEEAAAAAAAQSNQQIRPELRKFGSSLCGKLHRRIRLHPVKYTNLRRSGSLRHAFGGSILLKEGIRHQKQPFCPKNRQLGNDTRTRNNCCLAGEFLHLPTAFSVVCFPGFQKICTAFSSCRKKPRFPPYPKKTVGKYLQVWYDIC